MRRSDLPLSLGLCLATLLPAGVAEAYCRTSSCMTGGAHSASVCNPPTMDDCGVPIAWPQACVEFSVQQGASAKISFAETEQTLTKAFSTWMSAACPGGGTPHIFVVEGPPVICDQIEYDQTDGNANAIIYRDSSWPYEGSSNTLALTTVTYALDTGEVYDADMEINTADNNFTVGDTSVDFDLLSIVTHETGHFLGMAHSHDMSATMWPSYNEHSTNLRTLSSDDIAGICAIYPPASGSICGCDPTPRHGFTTKCAPDTALANGNAVALPTDTIYVVSTANFASAGTLSIGDSSLTYTGITATSFTGCSGGAGTLVTGDAVTQTSVAAEGVNLTPVCQGTTTTTTATSTLTDTASGCCSVAPGSEGPPGGRSAAALAALGAALLVARRKRRG